MFGIHPEVGLRHVLRKPDYADGLTTLYHGDCRDILPLLPVPQVVLTDPVWPDSHFAGRENLQGSMDPVGLFKDALAALPGLPKRLVVVLRFDNDPRFFRAVLSELPFFRTQVLRYTVPASSARACHNHASRCLGALRHHVQKEKRWRQPALE